MARRDDRDLIVVEREGGGAMKWLLLGAAVGAGLALLFAPKSGKDTRRDLSRSLRSLRDLADDTLEELKAGGRPDEEGDLRSMADGAGGYDEEEAEPAEEPPRKERSAAVSAREELERRLAAARARRRHPVPDDEEPVA